VLKPVNIGLLGLGTVGQGVARILIRNAAEIERRAGRGIVVKQALVRNRGRLAAGELGIDSTDDGAVLVADPDVQVICEMMGGVEPALSLILSAISHGKHVITANKELIAVHGNRIFKAAREHGVIVAFEPAVAGGIPIIKAIREGLSANRIEWLAGIINGTGNYILSEMAEKGRNFADVLAEAQALGYAEADPAFDVEGIDAAHKLTILASIAFGIPLQFNAVYTEGISKISREDVSYARELGYIIKHLGIARRRPDGVELRVHPTLIPQGRLIANVNGVMNAVLVQSDAVGPTLYYGPGAGAEPTGSAVVADIIDVVRALTTDPDHRVPHLAFQFDALSSQPVLAPEEFESAYYLRMRAQDKPGVMADITGIFGELGISLEAIIQKEPTESPDQAGAGKVPTVPIILLSRRVREGLIRQAIQRIDTLETVTQPVVMLRMESLG
jgi:homoserine dehydrogenase